MNYCSDNSPAGFTAEVWTHNALLAGLGLVGGIFPVHRTARPAGAVLAEDGRAFCAIVFGLVLSLLCSGIIGGVVTRQPSPWPVKIGIGTLALAAFLLSQWATGRRAHRLGQTGDLSEAEVGARQIISA